MSLRTRRRKAAIEAENVSRAVNFPGMEWDRDTTQVAAMAGLLEPALVPDEQARADRKAKMLAEFDRLHGRAADDVEEERPLFIGDIETVTGERATEIAERFAALIAETSRRT